MPDKLPDRCRQEFEKWARKRWPDSPRLFYRHRASRIVHVGNEIRQNQDGKYISSRVQWMWTGWEAAVAVAFMEIGGRKPTEGHNDRVPR